jgi:hypothetical protein
VPFLHGKNALWAGHVSPSVYVFVCFNSRTTGRLGTKFCAGAVPGVLTPKHTDKCHKIGRNKITDEEFWEVEPTGDTVR